MLIEELDVAWRREVKEDSVEFVWRRPSTRGSNHHVAERVLLRVINLIRF